MRLDPQTLLTHEIYRLLRSVTLRLDPRLAN
jgi:hypothetical protein